MNKKKITKAIAYTAATAAMCAAIDLLSPYVAKAWDYDDFKDDHYKMDALQAQCITGPSTKKEIEADEKIRKELAQTRANHEVRQKPIKTLLWGTIPNKCPICGGKE